MPKHDGIILRWKKTTYEKHYCPIDTNICKFLNIEMVSTVLRSHLTTFTMNVWSTIRSKLFICFAKDLWNLLLEL